MNGGSSSVAGGGETSDTSMNTLSCAGLPDNPFDGSSFTVLKKADVDLKVGGKAKTYSVVIKVLPTDDHERHTSRRKFMDLLKFSKEVQVYGRVLRCMAIFDEKRYASACVEPPVPKCYLGQLDAQNDVLVLENLAHSGFRKYAQGPHLSDIDHCRVVLRRLAHFHALSMLIQRDAEMPFLDLYPFAVDASAFREAYLARVSIVKHELCKYIEATVASGRGKAYLTEGETPEEKVDRHLQELFWRLVELRAQPKEEQIRLSVLAHGCLDLRNIVFQYDEASGRPIACKFLDFSTLTVASPVIDITYFLHSSVLPELASHHHSILLQAYHRSHLEAIKSFGMHGYEIELEDLINEYQARQDYGSMMACLLKPALFVLQCLNQVKESNGAKLANGNSNNGSEPDDSVRDVVAVDDITLDHTCSLKVDKNLVPLDLRLHSYLGNLSKACPCPCIVGSRDLTMAQLSADSLEELHIQARKEQSSKNLKAFDCNGGTKKTLKQLFKGLVTNGSANSATGGSSNNSSKNEENNDKDDNKGSKDKEIKASKKSKDSSKQKN